MERKQLSFSKIIGRAFVSVYLIILFAFVILLPISGGWSFIPLMMWMQPFAMIPVPWLGEILLFISNSLGTELSLVVIAGLGTIFNIVALYVAGHIIGVVLSKLISLTNWKGFRNES